MEWRTGPLVLLSHPLWFEKLHCKHKLLSSTPVKKERVTFYTVCRKKGGMQFCRYLRWQQCMCTGGLQHLQNIRIWHQIIRKHLMRLAGEGGKSEGFLMGQTVAQHSQFGTGRKTPQCLLICTTTFGELISFRNKIQTNADKNTCTAELCLYIHAAPSWRSQLLKHQW